jgi:SAM-dependent methyltransferase
MLAEIQRLATPELTRVFGHSGLYLRALSDIPPGLSGNMLAQVISLYRDGDGFDGQVRCQDDELPFASDSQSLVYACFVLESSLAPQALLLETRRMLKPEGVAMLFGLNPWSPCVLQHLRGGAHLRGVGTIEAMARESGLEIMSRQFLGPCRLGGAAKMGNSLWDSLRPAYLIVLRRRDSALTPLRKSPAAASLRPGVSLG